MSRVGRQTFVYDHPPRIAERTSIVGPKEGKGPLADQFDILLDDDLLGMKSWELAEGEMVRRAVDHTLKQASLRPEDVEVMISGDLNNQIIASSFAARALGIPFFGQYGACSTFVQSLVLGGALGEWVDLEERMERLGEKLKRAVKAQGDSGFVEGFVNVSLIICVGAMAIVGSIQDGIRGDYSMLAAKAVLDMIIVMIFASSYGVGAVFSALAIFVYQGAITLAAMAFGAFASERIIGDLSFVGSVLIFCVGVNIAFGKRFRVGNLLPSMAVTVALDLLFTALGIGMI